MNRLKTALFRFLGKEPEAVVVSFCSGPPELAARMVAEVLALVPDRRHYAVSSHPMAGVTTIAPADAPDALRSKRIGLAPTLLAPGRDYERIRQLASRMAPLKILAYNAALERHHLQLTTPIATWLFLRGVPLDRIWLRPKWFPLRREHSTWPDSHLVIDGRQPSPGRRKVGVLSPYFPWPLSHGGAVRIYNLLREAAKEFDIHLFAFCEDPQTAAYNTPVLDHCAQVVLFRNPRYREPRWSSVDPPEVEEFTSQYVGDVIASQARRHNIEILQTEYTHMARYGGDILVEHDVTFDLYSQIHARTPNRGTWWNLWRWRRFERKSVGTFPRVVVMSDRDAELLPEARTVILPNGVDLERFQPAPPTSDPHLLFVGSFAHFPNVVAFRWLLEEVLPLLPQEVRVSVISGRNPELYWQDPVTDPRVKLHGFISDVRPFYAAASIVVVPTQVSAGTNLKVIEGMAMQRAIVSTTSGVNGLGVISGIHAIVADTPAAFASAVTMLLSDDDVRHALAERGRHYAEERFGWERIGAGQRRLWRELLIERSGIRIRRGTTNDAQTIARIQLGSHGASQWEPETYFTFDVRVAEQNGVAAGFLVSRMVGPGELEILNIAVAPEARRVGIATALIEGLDAPDVFLEVRESNAPAQRLYCKLGFETVGRREKYYDDPVEAALVMRRSRA
ncbi:MAG: GNAT family N-acetyltransferase [Bryobacteraceae bacterium]|nr:GNAT family N-acetyltransferase [Bryobacteraceae bacterium]